MQESEIIFSNLSYLSSALPFAVVNENAPHIASLCMGRPTSNVQPCKRYLRTSIELRQRETQQMSHSFGSAVTEEWLSQLEKIAAKRLRSADRWRRWQDNGGSKNLHFAQGSRHSHLNQLLTSGSEASLKESCTTGQSLYSAMLETSVSPVPCKSFFHFLIVPLCPMISLHG